MPIKDLPLFVHVEGLRAQTYCDYVNEDRARERALALAAQYPGHKVHVLAPIIVASCEAKPAAWLPAEQLSLAERWQRCADEARAAATPAQAPTVGQVWVPRAGVIAVDPAGNERALRVIELRDGGGVMVEYGFWKDAAKSFYPAPCDPAVYESVVTLQRFYRCAGVAS